MSEGRRPNPIDVHVGARLRLRRLELGVSQEKLGESLGLTFQQIQKYEKGANRIGASRLFEISRVLDTPVTFFFEGLEEETERHTVRAPDISSVISTPEAIELNHSFARIGDAATRRRLTDLVRSLAEGD